MPFSLDPVDYYRRMTGTGGNETADDSEMFKANAARGYGADFGSTAGKAFGGAIGSTFGPVGGAVGSQIGGMIGDSVATNALAGAEWLDQQAEKNLGIAALDGITNVINAREAAEHNEKQAGKNRSANRTNTIIGAAGAVGAAVVGGLI